MTTTILAQGTSTWHKWWSIPIKTYACHLKAPATPPLLLDHLFHGYQITLIPRKRLNIECYIIGSIEHSMGVNVVTERQYICYHRVLYRTIDLLYILWFDIALYGSKCRPSQAFTETSLSLLPWSAISNQLAETHKIKTLQNSKKKTLPQNFE